MRSSTTWRRRAWTRRSNRSTWLAGARKTYRAYRSRRTAAIVAYSVACTRNLCAEIGRLCSRNRTCTTSGWRWSMRFVRAKCWIEFGGRMIIFVYVMSCWVTISFGLIANYGVWWEHFMRKCVDCVNWPWPWPNLKSANVVSACVCVSVCV